MIPAAHLFGLGSIYHLTTCYQSLFTFDHLNTFLMSTALIVSLESEQSFETINLGPDLCILTSVTQKWHIVTLEQ